MPSMSHSLGAAQAVAGSAMALPRSAPAATINAAGTSRRQRTGTVGLMLAISSPLAVVVVYASLGTCSDLHNGAGAPRYVPRLRAVDAIPVRGFGDAPRASAPRDAARTGRRLPFSILGRWPLTPIPEPDGRSLQLELADK
jgi:hypothetical protein